MNETIFGIVVMFFLGVGITFFVVASVTWLIEAINDYRDREEERKKRREKDATNQCR